MSFQQKKLEVSPKVSDAREMMIKTQKEENEQLVKVVGQLNLKIAEQQKKMDALRFSLQKQEARIKVLEIQAW